VVKILQGSVVTQTTLGGLTIYPPVANFLQCICAKNYENWMTVGKVLPFGARGSVIMPHRAYINELLSCLYFSGVAAIVDFAAMRDTVSRLGGNPEKINPVCPTELVIDHSVHVDFTRRHVHVSYVSTKLN